MERHRILGDKVSLYRRVNGGAWHCATSIQGNECRKSTRQKSLSNAKDVAEDWYLDLVAKNRVGDLHHGKSFKAAAEKFAEEYEAITQGRRSPKWVRGHKDRIRLHLLPFFGKMKVTEVNAGAAQDYRVQRMTEPEPVEGQEAKPWKPPAPKTIHNEIVTLSMVLKTALRHGWIDHVPNLSEPYRRQTKIERRPWFTPNQYKQLYTATRANAAKPKRARFKWHAEQLHDYILFMSNTGLRPDEGKLLEFRDVTIVDDDYSGEKILEIEVRGDLRPFGPSFIMRV